MTLNKKTTHAYDDKILISQIAKKFENAGGYSDKHFLDIQKQKDTVM